MNLSTQSDQNVDSIQQALALQGRGRLLPALNILQRVLAIAPNNFKALHGAGVLLGQLSRYEEALGYLTAAVTIQPANFAVHFNRGNVLYELKRYNEALTSYDTTLSLKPEFTYAYINRGNSLKNLCRNDEALASFDKAIELTPNNAELHYNRGNILKDMNRYEDALASYDKAISLKPDSYMAYNNRGIVLLTLKRYEDALASHDRAIALNPENPDSYYYRGVISIVMDRYEDALDDFNKAISIDSSIRYIYGDRVYAQMHIGLWEDFWHRVDELIELIEHDMHASQPFSLLAVPATSNILQKCASLYVADKYMPARQLLDPGERHHHERIRIGYFSADFHDHATAYLMAELFEKHDRSRFEIFAFSYGITQESEMRSRLVKAFDQFFEVARHSDQAIAELARKMEIDIAIDLKGFTRNSRPGIFALRPAPIQVNYLGYPGTMGAPFIDYIIADAVVVPEAHFEYYTEKVVQLPNSYQVNDSQRRIANTVPSRTALGLPETGFVFCCFNSSFKITPDIFTIWMRLLAKVAGSVLWLFESNKSIQQNLRQEALKRNIAPERLIFAPRIDLVEHLARLRQADIFLDTFYCNAHTTASDALWAGLPVLTCLGNKFAGRVAASLLNAVGLPELVTYNHEEYESLALKLAMNPEILATLKRKLAHNRSNHPLFNIDLFTQHIETAYISMWQRYQQGLEPDHIYVAP